MYRGIRQQGFLPVLQSFGSSPLESWDMKVKHGFIRRVTDEQVRALALELSSTNVSSCYIQCPKGRRSSLGIHLPYLVMIVKNMKKYFTFEVTVLDDRNVHRRFRMSNFQRTNRIDHFCTSMPLCLSPGWNEIYFDLSDFTRKAYNSNYSETVRIQVHANCRLRVIYFCDRMYEDKDTPQNLKIFLPTNHVVRKKRNDDEPVEQKIAEPVVDYESELHLSQAEEEQEDEQDEGEIYLEESYKSLAETLSKVKSEIKEEVASTPDGQPSFVTRIDEEDEFGEGFEGEYEIAVEEEVVVKVEKQEPEKVKEEVKEEEGETPAEAELDEGADDKEESEHEAQEG